MSVLVHYTSVEKVVSRLGVILAALVFVVACVSRGVSFPDWVNNPGEGVVGIAGTHYKGVNSQRKLAVARARQELASQRGVSIESVLVIYEYENATSAGSTSKQDTRITLDETQVQARVVEFWQNPQSGDIYVLLESL